MTEFHTSMLTYYYCIQFDFRFTEIVGHFPVAASTSHSDSVDETLSLVPCSLFGPNPEKVENGLKFGVIGHDHNIDVNDVKTKSEKYKAFANVIGQSQNVTVISGGMSSNAFNFANALKERSEPSAIVYVNWDALNGGALDYGLYAHNAPIIGSWTGLLVKTLADDGVIDLSKVIGVGFSLGAHHIGNMGYFLMKNKLQVAHIIALDPAAPCFEDYNLRGVQRDDAKLVQVIHTDVGWFGFRPKIGHIDVYPNDGKNQPQCSGNLLDLHKCWHSYAWKLYNLRNVKAGCSKSWDEFVNNKIDHSIEIGRDLNANHLPDSGKCTYYVNSPNVEN